MRAAVEASWYALGLSEDEAEAANVALRKARDRLKSPKPTQNTALSERPDQG